MTTTLIEPARAPNPANSSNKLRPPAPMFRTSSANTGISDWNGPTVRLITIVPSIRNRSVELL